MSGGTVIGVGTIIRLLFSLKQMAGFVLIA